MPLHILNESHDREANQESRKRFGVGGGPGSLVSETTSCPTLCSLSTHSFSSGDANVESFSVCALMNPPVCSLHRPTLSPFCTTSPSLHSSRGSRSPCTPLTQKDPCFFRRLLQTPWNNQIDLFKGPPLLIYCVRAKTNCSHSSRSEQLRSYRASIHPPAFNFSSAGFRIQPHLLLFNPVLFERRDSQTSLNTRLVDVSLHHAIDSHLRLEVLQLQELRLCRSHHQDPGSRRSAHVNAAGLIPEVNIDVTFLHVKRRNQTSTHWSSVHRGVLSSVTLRAHKESQSFSQSATGKTSLAADFLTQDII